MEDPTTVDETVAHPSPGRHAATTGSLTVADLLARGTGADPRSILTQPVPAASGAPTRATVQLVPAPRIATGPASEAAGEAVEPRPATVGDRPGVEPTAGPSPTRRAARAAAIGLGAAVLLGSLGGAAITTAPAPARTLPAAGAGPGGIDGAAALRPDLVGDRLGATLPPAGALPPAGIPPGLAPALAPLPPAAAPRGPDVAVVPRADPDSAATNLVADFFATAAARPDSAAMLLGPALAGSDPDGFRQAWSATRDVEVLSIRQEADGTVRATVALTSAAGNRLRTELLMTVAGAGQPRIVDAVLVSAQRLG